MKTEQIQPTGDAAEGATEQATQQPQGAKADPVGAQFQATAERLGFLTLNTAQQREELAERTRVRESLDAEITQRRLRLEQSERELLQLQGAANALQQVMGARDEANQPEVGDAR